MREEGGSSRNNRRSSRKEMVKKGGGREGWRDVEANYASFLASLNHKEGTQAFLTGEEGEREGGRARLGVTTMTGKKKGEVVVPTTEDEESEKRRMEGEKLKVVRTNKSNRRKTILKLKKTTKVAPYVSEEDEEGREDEVEEGEEDEALSKTGLAYKEWIERRPTGGHQGG